MARVVIVTGSSGGLGSELVRVLQRDGYVTYGIDEREHEATDLVWDLSQDLPAEMLKSLDIGTVSAIVHCAANQPTSPLIGTPRLSWEEAFRVNVLALQNLVSVFSKELLASGGSIVAVSSIHSMSTSPGMAAYAASKAALNSWVRSAAIELGPRVSVVGLSLGAIDTPKLREGLQRWAPEERVKQLSNLANRTPIGRIGTAAEVGEWIKFLLSANARFATGSVISVDGGVSARLSSE